MRITICGLVAAALLVASAGPATATAPTSTPLEGTKWKLAELPASALATLFMNRMLPSLSSKVAFEPGGVLAGADGCQPMSGTWSVTGGSLTIKPVTPLQRTCPDIIARQVAAFATALTSASSYRIDGGQLVLVGAGGEPVAKLSPVKSAPLEGTVWEAVRLYNGKGGSLGPIDGTTLAVTFGAGGTLTGNAGCNQFKGTFKTTGDALTIAEPAATRKACPDQVMAQEREFFAALSRATKFIIEEDRLDLLDKTGERQIVFRAARPQAAAPAQP